MPAGVGRARPEHDTHRYAAVREAIQAAARDEMRQHGPTGVRLRAAARRAGLAPSSVYRYFADREALMLSLRVDAYTHLIAALAAARDAARPRNYTAQWMSMSRALRRWALRNPDEFALLYTTPATDESMHTSLDKRTEAMSLVGTVLHLAIEAGQLAPLTDGSSVDGLSTPIPGPDGPLSPTVVQVTMGGWAALVGHIVLEPRRAGLIADPDSHFEEYLAAVNAGMGFVEQERPTGRVLAR